MAEDQERAHARSRGARRRVGQRPPQGLAEQSSSRREDHVVYVRPELVVEVAFNDVQESPQYPGGLALRFARVKGYRPDKAAMDADTLQTLQSIYRAITGREAPSPRL